MVARSRSSPWRFQSAPGFWAGRNPTALDRVPPSESFNPLPAFGPGETHDTQPQGAGIVVSIRSRLLGREKRVPARWRSRFRRVSIRSRLLGREKLGGRQQYGDGNRFQSAPGFWAGRNSLPCYSPESASRFQSAPGFWAGRNARAPGAQAVAACFNPLPAFGPGETVGADNSRQRAIVSIRSRLLGREKPGLSPRAACKHRFQSAPGFWAGRNAGNPMITAPQGCFNPLPAFGPGETS